ncbi:MAG: nucleotidyltransferase domain-containing protein [Bacteriovoracaceae bacterium]
MKSTQFGPGSKKIDAICSVLSKHSMIDEVILYGPRAKGTYRGGSDIDLVILKLKADCSDFRKP